MSTQDLTLDWTTDFETVVKAPEPDMVFKDDPVALAWAGYRLYLQSPGQRWSDFDTLEVTDEDRTQAQAIRSYYTGRILMDMMKSKNPTSAFRQKLYGLLIGETGLKKKDIGLLYRLPYFYVEDTELDQVIAETTPAQTRGSAAVEIAGTFTLIKRILVSRKHGDYAHFWLRHHKRSEPFLIVVKTDNPLLSLLAGILANPVQLSATAHVKRHSGYHRGRLFCQLANVELVS
jgi:hypothetical protein